MFPEALKVGVNRLQYVQKNERQGNGPGAQTGNVLRCLGSWIVHEVSWDLRIMVSLFGVFSRWSDSARDHAEWRESEIYYELHSKDRAAWREVLLDCRAWRLDWALMTNRAEDHWSFWPDSLVCSDWGEFCAILYSEGGYEEVVDSSRFFLKAAICGLASNFVEPSN